ncbi:MAG: hypothetical protein GX485_01280 [Clostridiales bacterium]|nr:hypothetical protein [Clostridiales bacterium]
MKREGLWQGGAQPAPVWNSFSTEMLSIFALLPLQERRERCKRKEALSALRRSQ